MDEEFDGLTQAEIITLVQTPGKDCTQLVDYTELPFAVTLDGEL